MIDAPVSLRGRRDIVDVFRAVSLFGMVGYHLTWDLAYFGFVDRYVPFARDACLFAQRRQRLSWLWSASRWRSPIATDRTGARFSGGS